MSTTDRTVPDNHQTADPAFVIIWDPELIDEADYIELIEAVGNVVRAHGCAGVKLLRPNTYGVPADAEVLL